MNRDDSIISPYDRIQNLTKQLEDLQAELDAVMYLGVEKWFDDPEKVLAHSNRATMAGQAREIALKAIEAQAYKVDIATKALTLISIANDDVPTIPDSIVQIANKALIEMEKVK